MDLRICIIGGTGKLGKLVCSLAKKSFTVSSKTDPAAIPYASFDIFLDVSSKDVICNFLPAILKAKKPLVVGSTGHSHKTLISLKRAGEHIPVLLSSNFSKGVFLLKKLLHSIQVTPSLITETHHTEKKDAPSGTAIDLANTLSTKPKIESVRKADVFGVHTITYKFPHEELELTHRASSRKLFADGAIAACSFLYQKEKGYYTMDDVYEE